MGFHSMRIPDPQALLSQTLNSTANLRGNMGTILGFHGDNGKGNGNYSLGLYIYSSSPFVGTLNIRCRKP